jgi:hypothetical protein
MSSTKPKKNEAREPAQPPVAKLRVGLISGSIWERKTENGTFHAVTFERRYRDGDTWKSSHSYDAQDLLALAKLADMAHSKIIALQASGD